MTQEAYRGQLSRLARAMAMAKSSEVQDDLDQDSAPSFVKMFVDGNLDKRCDKLLTQLEFVAPAFEDFEPLVVEFLARAKP